MQVLYPVHGAECLPEVITAQNQFSKEFPVAVVSCVSYHLLCSTILTVHGRVYLGIATA